MKKYVSLRYGGLVEERDGGVGSWLTCRICRKQTSIIWSANHYPIVVCENEAQMTSRLDYLKTTSDWIDAFEKP